MQNTQCIKSLYKLAQGCRAVDFHHQAFNLISKSINFDLAGWGESINSIDTVVLPDASTYKNNARLLKDYNKLPHLNTATEDLLNSQSNVISTNLDLYDPICDSKYTAWAEINNIQNCLHTTIMCDDNLLAYSIVLWRSKYSSFSNTDQHCKQIIIPHLIESFRLCRRLDIRSHLTKQWKFIHGFAICNQQGLLLDFNEKFIELLKKDYPGWKSSCLPDEFSSTFRSCMNKKLKNGFYRWSLLENLYLIIVTALGRLQALSNREFQVAYNYTKGLTYKEIATKFCIAPSTARNHISNIYTKLNINSRGMLVQLFE